MILKFCLFIITIGVILTSCSLTSQESESTNDSNNIETDIYIDSTVGTETEIQSDSTISTETEPYTETSNIETSEPPADDTDNDSTPELNDISYVSPNGKYTLVLVPAINEINQNIRYNSLSLKEVANDTEIASLDETFYDISVEWSSDSNYAAVKEIDKNRQYSDTIMVFDISNGTVLSMPRLEIQNKIQAEVSDTVNLYSCDLLSCEWADNHTLKVDFDMKTGVSFYSKSHLGYYTFDLESDSITTLEYDDIAANTPDMINLTEDEIKAIVDENLDIIMSDIDGFYSEKEFINAHPEAFENIIALADVALPYLNEIIDKYPHRHFIHQENLCGIVAQFVAYIIDPNLYDLLYISPDGKYILKAQIGTFFGTEWGGGRIIEYDKLSIIDNSTKHILVNTTATSTNRYYGLYTNFNVNWSPDSQYVAVQSSDMKTYTTTDIFDAKNERFITLPSVDEIERMISNNDNYDYTESIIDEWLQNNIVKINIFLRNNILYFIEGFYIYNLDEKKILNINYDMKNYSMDS